MSRKDFNVLFRELRRQGWEVKQTSKGHFQAKDPSGQHPQVVFSTNSNDRRALHNTLKRLSRSGFDLSAHGAPAKEASMEGTTDTAQLQVPEEQVPGIDELFERLKDARLEHQVCMLEVREATAAFEQARERLDAAQAAAKASRNQMAKVKTAFDAAFQEEDI